ncbi:MAG: DUF512 domain-containing protein [Clostridia bacterium]|nr:DUF512 domain-containing protein [Clostridia bacterium]
MAVKISNVKKNSICELKGIKAEDELLKINGNDILDVLDYDFYMTEQNLTLTFKCIDGKFKVIKTKSADCGLEFETYLMDKQQHCKNKCIFCFIDQLPKGLRESLYFKDDDSRLSFLFGNYITLTNISEHEIERIIKMHISPVNISVHTMNPELRVQMMKNKNAGESLKIIKRLADAGITMNTQLVLCPGINDGDELRYSIEQLSALYPSIQSIAAVPVGLTKFRDGLPKLEPYNKQTAGEVIDIIGEYSAKFRKEFGVGLCYPADEFFIKAERDLPNADYYDDYPQLDNGVGLVRSFYDDFLDELDYISEKSTNRKVTLATGADFYPYLCDLCKKAEEKYGVEIGVQKIINNFFGETITVSGLITGIDLYEQLKSIGLGECLLLPSSMISDYTNHTENKNKFLDDMTVEELESKLNVKIVLTNGGGGQLLRDILGVK